MHHRNGVDGDACEEGHRDGRGHLAVTADERGNAYHEGDGHPSRKPELHDHEPAAVETDVRGQHANREPSQGAIMPRGGNARTGRPQTARQGGPAGAEGLGKLPPRGPMSPRPTELAFLVIGPRRVRPEVSWFARLLEVVAFRMPSAGPDPDPRPFTLRMSVRGVELQSFPAASRAAAEDMKVDLREQLETLGWRPFLEHFGVATQTINTVLSM